MIRPKTKVSVEEEELEEFRMYPNPVADVLHLDLGTNLQEGLVEIVVMKGQIVWSKEVNGLTSLDVDVRGFTSGFYFVIIQTLKESKLLNLVVG